MSSSSLRCSKKPLSSMNVEAVLYTNKGLGETSYDTRNSSIPKRNVDNVKSLVTESAAQVYMSLRPDRFTMADLGCASGRNTLITVEDIIRSIGKVVNWGSRTPEFSVLLNDLPANDFNIVFTHLLEFTCKLKADDGPMVFLFGVPGSFYGRLFPSRSVHMVCSFSSLHWLSQVPPGLSDEINNTPINKGKMVISCTSSPAVLAAYGRQFQRDFSLFLRWRAAEVVPGGHMVLSVQGRQTEDHTDTTTTLLFDLLSEALAALVAQGLVEQEAVDAYDEPFYAPSAKEIEEEVRKEGSFRLDYARMYQVNLSSGRDAKTDGRMVSMAVRDVQESMLSDYFGAGIIDALFHKYTELVTESMEREKPNIFQLGVVLVRL